MVEELEPAYLALSRQELEARVVTAQRELQDCCACPRACHMDRLDGRTGVCGMGRYARVASAGPHFGEEDCLRGWRGSGTIFFAGCNLRCVFCQNWDISQRSAGREYPAVELAALMLQLQRQGCHNINLVTPEHVVPQVVEAVVVAVERGLHLPLVYNTSGYDTVASLRLLDGIVDIYMPDFKFWRRETARRLAKARDYPECARAAILEMHRQVGPLQLDRDGLARRGVLVRHLVMPGQTDEAAAIFRWLSSAVSQDTYLNIMGQYRPAHEVLATRGTDRVGRYAEIAHAPGPDEMSAAFRQARRAGLWRFDHRAGA
jgi:putative pyruvate formate lyase activating enzyme